MKAYKAVGIVIKRKNYNEADRILTVFTKNSGKIKIIAKGVRKITSKRSSHIELLNYSVFSLHKTSNGMPILTEVESLNNYSDIKKDLAKIGRAYHICELIDGLCAENQENEQIFNLLNLALETIAKDSRHDLITYRFELKLLKLLGFFHENQNISEDKVPEFIESILERKLKARQILPQLS